MKRSRTLVDDRRNKVLEVLQKDGSVKVEVLADLFGVSTLTIRRDLQYLADHNKLERFYGGAVILPEQEQQKNEENELNFYRKNIAKYAATLVEDGDTIFINTSATAIQMLKYIRAKRVTVITNNGKAIHMKHSPDVTVILSGGELREIKDAMVGEFATNNVSRVTAKKSFIGCSGISLECGMTTEILGEVRINELMCTRVTEKAYILADHTKFGHNSSFVSCPLDKIENIITDEKVSQTMMNRFQENSVQVYCVGKEQDLPGE